VTSCGSLVTVEGRRASWLYLMRRTRTCWSALRSSGRSVRLLLWLQDVGGVQDCRGQAWGQAWSAAKRARRRGTRVHAPRQVQLCDVGVVPLDQLHEAGRQLW
jgi:hypothetical protein